MLHCCRWPGCNRLIQTYLLMCPDHWRRLPKKHRHAIWRVSPRQADFAAAAYVDAVAAALTWARRQPREVRRNEQIHDHRS
jgi:hypothetical protein